MNRIALLVALLLQPSVALAVERKPQASTFEIRDLNDLMMNAVDNSSNQVKFAAPPGEFMLYGQVVDSEGNPVSGAQVLLSETTRGSNLYLPSFDVTDELGRFVAQAAPSKLSLFIRSGDTYFRMPVTEPGDVMVQLPQLYPVKFEIGSIAENLTERLWVTTNPPPPGQAAIFGDQSTTIEKATAGDFRLGPGEYRVYGSRRLPTKADPVTGRVELGQIQVTPDGPRTFELGRREGTRLSGTIADYDELLKMPAVVGLRLSLSIPQVESQSIWRTIDTITCQADGSFAFDPVPRGDYMLRVSTIVDHNAAPVANAGGFGNFSSAIQSRTLYKERLQLAAESTFVSLPVQREVDDTVAAVHRILDSEHPQPNVSWSWSDVQISQLAGLGDRQGVIAELHRLLEAEDTPYAWRWLVIDSLWRIRPISEETKATLVRALDQPINHRWRGSILRSIRNMKGEAIGMLDLIIDMKDDDDWRVRYAVADTMGEVGRAMIRVPDKVIDTAIDLLDDPHGLVRQSAAGSLGQLHSPKATKALRGRMSDPYGPARAMAAWALFESSGEAEPAVSAMIDLLENSDHEGKRQAAYYLQMFDHRAAPAIPALRANATYEKKPPFRGTRETIQYQLRRSAETAIAAIEDSLGREAESNPFTIKLDASPNPRLNSLQFDASWGEAVDGLELGIIVGSAASTFSTGERVPITLLIRNITGAPIRFEIDRRLADVSPEVTNAAGKRQYVKNERLIVARTYPAVTLAPGAVTQIPHPGIGLGKNPKPGKQMWFPYLEDPIAGQHTISQRYRITIHDQANNTKTAVWTQSGAAKVSW